MLAAFANFVFVSCAIHHANVQGGVSNSVPTSMDNVTSINKGCGDYVEVMDSNYTELVLRRYRLHLQRPARSAHGGARHTQNYFPMGVWF